MFCVNNGCNKLSVLRAEMHKYSIRKNPQTGIFYYVDEQNIAFDPNPVVSRGLNGIEALEYCNDLNGGR